MKENHPNNMIQTWSHELIPAFVRLIKCRLLALFLLTGIGPAFAADPDDVLLLSFFRGNGQAGIFLAASDDGLHFTELNDGKPIMKPAPWARQNLTRDPSMVYQDGKFHAVWTTGWKGDCFAYAESKDLVTWSEPVRVEPFGGKKPKNTWAPEICWDPLQKNYLILWSSTLEGNGNHIYSTRTADGKTFSPAQLFLDRPFGCIDAFPFRQAESNRWLLIYKNEEAETKGGKNLHVATAPLDFSQPWVDLVDHPIIGPGTTVAGDSMTEGPGLLKQGDEFLLYWDSPLRGKKPAASRNAAAGKAAPSDSFGMASSRDLTTWTDHTAELKLPVNVRHGTVFRAPRSAVGWLKNATGAQQTENRGNGKAL